jgi:crotonobetaine/carnitine-CoA ligase
MQINECLDRWAEKTPEKIYLFSKDGSISYKELHQKVNRIASSLLKLGVGKGDRIALYLRNTPTFIYSWFALNRIGAVMVPINTSLLVGETAYILKDSQVIGVIAEEDVVDSVIFPALKECLEMQFVITTGDQKKYKVIPFSDLYRESGHVDYTPLDDNQLASILYTSGTTGNPKGVMCAHRYYNYLGSSGRRALDIRESDRLLTCLPLFHMNAQVLATVGSLMSNASLILLEKFDASTFWQDVTEYEATVFYYLGSILPILLKLPVTEDEKNSKLRLAVGAQANPVMIGEYEKRWNLKMIELYGMTEGGGTINPLNARKKGSCGKAFFDHEVRVVDENDIEKSSGEIGEIIFKGPSLTLGYWNNQKATSEAYRNGWMHSGDMGYMDNEAYLFFVDRKKDIIRRNGENISSAEIEKVLMAHPKIVEAAAIPVRDEIRNEEVKVYVVLKENEDRESLSPEKIIAWCEARLASFKIPRYIDYLDSLPKTPTQKIQKSILKKESEDLSKNTWDRFAFKRSFKQI